MDFSKFDKYFRQKQQELSTIDSEPNDSYKKEVPLMPNQYCYTHNLLNNKFENVKGIKNVLGYENDSIDLAFYYKRVHPDDLDLIFETIKQAYSFAEKNAVIKPFNSVLTILFRIKNAENKYAQILRVSSVQSIRNNKIIKTFSICTEVTKLYLYNKLALDFNSHALEDFKPKEILHISQQKKLKSLTQRENKILHLIGAGHTSLEISEELAISIKTVNTHRRNIVKKMGTKNLYILAKELFA
ncbi:MAG: hypothetical protein GVY19_00025 [Bacteroidetes bacterium]|jgi:DNA-binding CsgD family transcriptional regulator|nr:hypothetical protein [Bacteroidota bacterium]